MSDTESQIYEIIAIDHDDYKERIEAIEQITDFHTLEGIFVGDEYITVRMVAYDRLTELFYKTKQYKKMLKVWKDISEFSGWIHFIINELGRGNNIEKTIRWILEKEGYPFDDFWQRWYVLKSRNKIFQQIVDVYLTPVKSDDYYSEEGLRVRYTKYGIQYQYEMVIKILKKNIQNELFHEYVYVRTWNSNLDTHKKLYKKLNYEEI